MTTAAPQIDTKTASRRDLSFSSFEEVAAELDTIEGWIGSGSVGVTANWSAGGNMDHCATFLKCTIDGFPSKAPAPIRWLMSLMYKKRALSGEPLPAGFKLPKQASFMLPEDGISDAEGLGRLRTQVNRVLAGERMTHPSPLFGQLSHEEWTIIQLKHFALHLGFITGG